MNTSILTVFIPTFLFVSLTPGMCMTLSLSMGMTIGFRRTFWMMYGELVGFGLVAGASVIGVAALTLRFPEIFLLFKILGGLYLGFLGIQLWQSRGKMAVNPESVEIRPNIAPRQLAAQGFITAVANPKGWAFFVALLPPFVDASRPLPTQLTMLLSIILAIEFASLMLYAGGGKTLNHFLMKKGNVRTINNIAGTLMVGVGIGLMLV